MEFFDSLFSKQWVSATFCVFLGFCLKAIFDLWMKPRKAIGYFIQGKAIIQGLEKEGLEVTYHGEMVQRLDYYKLIFKNDGNLPLENIPISISTSGPIRGKLNYKGPDGACERTVNLDDELSVVQKFNFEDDFKKLTLSCNLLNMRESFSLEFLVANGTVEPPVVLIRSPGLVVKELTDVYSTSIILFDLISVTTGPLLPSPFITSVRHNTETLESFAKRISTNRDSRS
jgi:hypothetical protein